MEKAISKIFREFKIDDFKVAHESKPSDEITRECLEYTEEALDNAYHYHFHKLPDANRAEMINMINNYVLEAILPPVVEKIVQRQIVLEHRLERLIRCLQSIVGEIDK